MKTIIEEYLATHPVASQLASPHSDLLRRILSLFIHKQSKIAILNTSILISYCSQNLKNSEYPEPAIAKIATKGAEILFAGKS